MSLLSEYKGRTVDVAAFKGWELGKSAQVTQTLVLDGKGGELIAGIEKLVQRFTIELLTEYGSLTYLPRRGCSFISDSRTGMWQTSGDVSSSFATALLAVADNLSGEESTSDPTDERFSSATLESVALLGDSVTLHVNVVSMAGTTFTALMPINVVTY